MIPSDLQTSGTFTNTVVSYYSTNANTLPWKPTGRERHFDGLRRGLARRMRIPWVRRTLWERDHPEARLASINTTYGQPWTSTHCLANFSFACVCHPAERYKRHPKHRKGKR